MTADSEDQRLAFILEGQQHCDHFLTPIADPAGKSVLVAGSGAGTEMLWCLRHGAREVVGVDVAPQTADALTAACSQLNLDGRFSMIQIAIEDATKVGRRFDLVLSNNVFEHVGDLPRSLRACGELVERDGRIAIFTDPLFYSSAGSHLPHEPWEHLWGDAEALRAKALRAIPSNHALAEMPLDEYLFSHISLNRMRISEFIDAVRSSGLVLLNLRIIPDRNLSSIAQHRDKLAHLPIADLTIEGIAAELVLADSTSHVSTEAQLLSRERTLHEKMVAELQATLEGERATHAAERSQLEEAAEHWTSVASEVKAVLDGVERSVSFRVGRMLTAPLRWVRRSSS